ncbi:MAG: toll/interleukin-1 receptor domain-containing protein, partial [Verrucomicrobia bacterium]|nr:toll/interleukin-1 receptor domain-containing protein [Verrucomicrobiota bacterium]
MKVSLSHSTKDKEFVSKLEFGLKRAGIETWLCEVDVIPGANFVAEIDKGLQHTDLAVLIWSPNAAKSEWTKLEWTSILAREIEDKRTHLLIVRLKEHPLPELLRTKHYIDARKDPDKALAETVQWISGLSQIDRKKGVKSAGLFLDYEPQDFIGRTEYLEMLFATLAQKPGKILLHGEPGSGKSTLALKFAWKTQGEFEAVTSPCGTGVLQIGAVETPDCLDV